MAQKVLAAMIQEAYIRVILTRSVDDLVRYERIFKSQVPPAVRRDRPAGQSLPRPTDRGRLAVSVDRRDLRATVRQAGRIVSVAMIVPVGADSDGLREVLGMGIGPLEAKIFRTIFLRKVARRGLRGVDLVVPDARGHQGSCLHRRVATLPRQSLGTVRACWWPTKKLVISDDDAHEFTTPVSDFGTSEFALIRVRCGNAGRGVSCRDNGTKPTVTDDMPVEAGKDEPYAGLLLPAHH
jgi:hypothetical protein